MQGRFRLGQQVTMHKNIIYTGHQRKIFTKESPFHCAECRLSISINGAKLKSLRRQRPTQHHKVELGSRLCEFYRTQVYLLWFLPSSILGPIVIRHSNNGVTLLSLPFCTVWLTANTTFRPSQTELESLYCWCIAQILRLPRLLHTKTNPQPYGPREIANQIFLMGTLFGSFQNGSER